MIQNLDNQINNPKALNHKRGGEGQNNKSVKTAK